MAEVGKGFGPRPEMLRAIEAIRAEIDDIERIDGALAVVPARERAEAVAGDSGPQRGRRLSVYIVA